MSSYGEAKNPDTRDLPPGWVQQYDSNYKTWCVLVPLVPLFFSFFPSFRPPTLVASVITTTLTAIAHSIIIFQLHN